MEKPSFIPKESRDFLTPSKEQKLLPEKIKLNPEKPEIREKMKRKLLEYYERQMENWESPAWKDRFYESPEQIKSDRFSDTQAKIKVTETLLRDGQFNTEDLGKTLIEDEDLSPKIVQNALRVINDYIETGGQLAKSGTGFK